MNRVSRADNGEALLKSVDRQLLRAAQAVPDRSSIRDWLAGASWPTIVAWIGVQLAEALEEAHRQGVLHRDVKPANVLLSGEGIPKLADFNVSLTGAAGSRRCRVHVRGLDRLHGAGTPQSSFRRSVVHAR